uniref:Thyroglobulin type-1 domain-containing protein n=1 Tax=Buteo japonicus TaxID=224669 RepID=A0A8B9ZAB7_9AVES
TSVEIICLHLKTVPTGSSLLFQCRPSKGRKRGYCWCVDKYGQPLPGYDGKGKGDVHCYNLESK